MKITYALASVSRRAGGLFEICRRLARTVGTPAEMTVLGLVDAFTNDDLGAWAPLQPWVFPVRGLAGFGFAPGYATCLEDSKPDLVHVHGLWMYPALAAYQWSRRGQRPVVCTIHGMLDPWAVRNSGLKKRLVRALFQDAALRSAACLQVNSQAEYETVRAFGLRNPICIIPNGIDLPDLAGIPNVECRMSNVDGRKVLLYLGRLHPKKNLGPLLHAWAALQKDSPAARDWVLAIAGWDQGGYEGELRLLTSDLCLLNSVLFLGPQFGEAKAACYAHCDAFILPSLSEGLPMVVLEAWAYAKPVLMTDECNLPEGFTASAALRIGTAAPSIAGGLRQLVEMSDAERITMGARGRDLVTTQFSWPHLGEEMRRVCEWAVGGGAAPKSVRLK